MKVLVTGASGLIGSALLPQLKACGHEVVTVSRSADRGDATWDPENQPVDPALFHGIDAVVHLAGSNIAAGRWTEARKQEIRDSRVLATRRLVDAMLALPKPPAVLVCSSAIGIYGDRGDELLDEASTQADGFLAAVCREWEAEANRARDADVRVVNVRTGVVLSPAGGALGKVLPVFRAGLGGPVGGGRQWMSWISMDDLVAVFVHALTDLKLDGPVNATAPGAVTNAEFAAVLGKVLGRPTMAPVPATVLKLMYGEMAEETVLASTRVAPRRLLDAGFEFRHAELEAALHSVLAS